MAQTMKDKNNSSNGQNTASKRTRPGQRQQERLQRLARRRRRIRIWVSAIVSVAVIALAVYLFFLYQNITAQQAAAAIALHNKQAAATATARAKVQATGTAVANVQATAQTNAAATAVATNLKAINGSSPTPTAGAAKPPAVTGTTVTTGDGLKYIDVKTGSGPAAKAGDGVWVLYTGWLQSTNKEFDSSYDHGGQPYEVTPLGKAQIIPGWNEGLVGMKVGGTRRLIIPPSLAYGAQGYSSIPGNATLIFDVTVVYIK